MKTVQERLADAMLALEGLSIGDAFGRHSMFTSQPVEVLGRERPLFDPPWQYSDDTEMALAIVEVLSERGATDQDALAASFARRFERDPEKGYGAVAYWMLHQIVSGADWRTVSRQVFQGQGSMGNGAAMRVAPLGAYYAEPLDRVVEEARSSAEVTHAHPDGQAGAIAVAVAAACALSARAGRREPGALFTEVIRHTPNGPTREGLERAAALGPINAGDAASALGDGRQVLSSDTVPFALWCAAWNLADFETAIWTALLGCAHPDSDRDTVCAIVGGVVALSAGPGSIPEAWKAARGALDR